MGSAILRVVNCVAVEDWFLEYNGSDAFGIFNTPIFFTGDFELETEFSTTHTGGWQVICGRTDINHDFLAVNIGGDVRINVAGNSITTEGFNVNDGLMHHVRVTRIGTTVSLYIDDVLGISGNVAPVQSQFDIIGSYDTNRSFPFNGIIRFVNFKDTSIPPNSRDYIIRSRNTVYELPEGVSGDVTHPQAMAYSNILAGDWSGEWAYNELSGDCGGSPGWEHATLPTFCEAQ